MRTPDRRGPQAGTSLIEFVTAIAIMGLLTYLASHLVDSSRQHAAKTTARENIQGLASQLKASIDRASLKFIEQDCGASACRWTAFVRDADYVATTPASVQFYEYIDVACETAPTGAALSYTTLLSACGAVPYPCSPGQRPVVRWFESPTRVPVSHPAHTTRFVGYDGPANGLSISDSAVASTICFTRQAGLTMATITMVGVEPGLNGQPFVIEKSHVFTRRQPGSARITP